MKAEDSESLAPWTRALPSDWACARIDAVADVLFSNVDKHAHEGEDAIRLCNYVDVYKNEYVTARIDFMEATADPREIEKFQLHKGDVLATKDSEESDDIAIPALVAEDLPGVICGYHLALIRPRSTRITGEFLAWLHRSKPFRAQYEAKAIGVTRFGLSQHAFRSALIPLPPRGEQELIDEYLRRSCAAIDAAVSAKQRQIEALDGVRKDTVQRAVTRGLDARPRLRKTESIWIDEIPSNWELVSLKRISETQTGLTLGKVYDGTLIERPYLRVANVQDGHLNLDEVTTIEVPEHVALRVTLRPGDVLMTEGGDLDKLGRGTIWSGEISGCLHQNHIFAVRCFEHKLLPSFLAYLTASQYGRDYFEATGKRTTNLASTNSTKVGLFPIPRPSIEEQQAICTFLDARLAHLSRTVAIIESQIATLAAYRNSLVHEYATGQRRVTESNKIKRAAHG